MEKCIRKINEYFDDFELELRKKRVIIAADLKFGRITPKEFEEIRSNLLTYHQISSNIRMFFNTDNTDLFDYFYDLGHILVTSYFSAREAFKILMYVIERNHRLQESEEKNIINLSDVQEYEFDFISRGEVIGLVNSGKLQSLLAEEISPSNEKEKKLIEAIENNIEKFLIVPEKLISNNNRAYEVSKIFVEEDIETFLKTLKNLGIEEECCTKVGGYLKNRFPKMMNKREQEISYSISSNQPSFDKYFKIVEKYLITMEDVLDSLKKASSKIKIKSFNNKTDSTQLVLGKMNISVHGTNRSAEQEVGYIVKYLRLSDEECVGISKYFVDYHTASSFMIPKFNITPKDAYLLLAHFARRNYLISVASPETKVITDMSALAAIKFESASHLEIERIVKDPDLFDKFQSEEDLTEKENLIREEIFEKLPLFTDDLTDFCYHNDRFYEYFVSKFPNIDLDDIVDALEDLEFLEVIESVRDSLKNYFLGIFRNNLDKSSTPYDLEIAKIYLETLIEDKKERKEFLDNIEKHNKFVNRKKETPVNDKNIEESPKEKKDKKIYYSENEVREFKKYIREYYDTYHVKLVNTPDFANLQKCVDCLIKLEEDKFSIERFLSFALSKIVKLDDYVTNYEDLITLVSILIKYRIPRDKVDFIIRKYKNLKGTEENEIAYLASIYEEVGLYDENLAKEIETLLSQVFIINDEDYKILKELSKDIINKASVHNSKTDYEYNLGLKKLGR